MTSNLKMSNTLESSLISNSAYFRGRNIADKDIHLYVLMSCNGTLNYTCMWKSDRSKSWRRLNSDNKRQGDSKNKLTHQLICLLTVEWTLIRSISNSYETWRHVDSNTIATRFQPLQIPVVEGGEEESSWPWQQETGTSPLAKHLIQLSVT